jgi:hypothetical protein
MSSAMCTWTTAAVFRFDSRKAAQPKSTTAASSLYFVAEVVVEGRCCHAGGFAGGAGAVARSGIMFSPTC